LVSKQEREKPFLDAMQDIASEEDIPFEVLRELHVEYARAKRRGKILSKYIKPDSVGAEIGVFWGHFAEEILEKFKPNKLYLVDPWDKLYPTHYPQWGAYTLFGKLPTKLCREYVENLASDNPEVSIFHGFSYEFYETLNDQSLDWIYIDGNHQYEKVLDDINGALPKLKKDGVIMGDDFRKAERFQDKGVNRAVREVLNGTGRKLVLEAPYQFVLLPASSADESVNYGD